MIPQGEKELKELLTEEEFFNYKFYFTPEVQAIMQTTARLLEDKPNTIKFNNPAWGCAASIDASI